MVFEEAHPGYWRVVQRFTVTLVRTVVLASVETWCKEVQGDVTEHTVSVAFVAIFGCRVVGSAVAITMDADSISSPRRNDFVIGTGRSLQKTSTENTKV